MDLQILYSPIWQCGTHQLELTYPLIMGIVNVTPDSFSDGGQCACSESAIAHGLQLIKEGADILDIGGESTRPGHTPVSVSEEIERVANVVEVLSKTDIPISIDTTKSEVAAAALSAGASIINDVNGFIDPAMQKVARESSVGLVAMRSGCTLEQFMDDLPKRLIGVDRMRIAADPGFGFVETYQQDLDLYYELKRLSSAGYPTVVGLSRKRFIGRITGIDDPSGRDEASAQLTIPSIFRGGAIIRTHNVSLQKQHQDRYFAPRPPVQLTDVTINEKMSQSYLCHVTFSDIVSKLYDSHLAVAKQPTTTAYVALGSNLGDRWVYLQEAISCIENIPLTHVIKESSYHETKAMYVTNQPDFLNMVVRVETGLGLFAFFTELQAIEVAMKRCKTIDKGPRNIDLDVLVFGSEIYNTKELTVPHPKMSERDFVMIPLLEVIDAQTYEQIIKPLGQ